MKQITDEQIETIKYYLRQRQTLKVIQELDSLEEIKEIQIKNEELPAN
jgi:hypothetical protein